jgi:predicted nucleic acid-binding protein
MLSKNPRSPVVELFERLRGGEFQLVWCPEIRDEVVEKLLDRGLDAGRVAELIAELVHIAEQIELELADIVSLIAADPDDDVVVACAVKGKATHLVTYDPHFGCLGGEHRGIKVLDGLHFLYAVRGPASS